MITGAQVKAARKLLGWPRDRLSPRAGLSVSLLRKIEDGLRTPTNDSVLEFKAPSKRQASSSRKATSPG